MSVTPADHTLEPARRRARRQLRRVLVLLAIFDVGALVLVIGLAAAWTRNQIPVAYFLLLVVGGLGGIIAGRIALGVRLKRRSGDL